MEGLFLDSSLFEYILQYVNETFYGEQTKH